MAELGGLLQLLAIAAQEQGQGAAHKLPSESVSSTGFTWVDILKPVDCDAKDKEALCVASRMATMVTRQVVSKTDECEFVLKVLKASGEKDAPIFIGIANDVPVGFESFPIGHPRLANSIGVCAYPAQGAIVHAGETRGTTPGIKDGDIIKLQVSKGSKVQVFHGSQRLHAFQVGGDGKFRFAASLSSKGQRVQIMDSASSPEAGLEQLLRQVLGHTDGDAATRLPKESYSASKGFTFVDTLRSVDCDPHDKVATCVASRTATMVTAQVLCGEDECEFAIRVLNAGGEEGKPIMFGVVGAVPSGFGHQPIGHSDFRGSFGACCFKTEGSLVLKGEKKGDFPGVVDGDILRVRVGKGCKLKLCKGTDEVVSFNVGGDGKFRLGVTFASKGQSVEIISSSSQTLSKPGAKALKVGCEVDMPVSSDPRLSGMRTRYSEEMGKHCSRVAKVVKVAKRCVRCSLDGREFWWDTELFPRGISRCCPEGCNMTKAVLPKASHICDVCNVLLPKGQHDYDVCQYCQGHLEVPREGSKVIRGPTWKWKQQDGVPHSEGTVKGTPTEEGWLKVQWSDGSSNSYRVGQHYQDVWAAHSNGLEGMTPKDERSDSGLDAAGAAKFLVELLKHAAEESSPKVALPEQSHSSHTGFTFVENCIPEVVVGSSKKDASAVKEHPSHWGSIVTEQVVPASTSSPMTFTMQIKAMPMGSQGLFAWGLCTSAATNFQQHVPGMSKFEGSIGCVVKAGKPCVVLHDDKVVAKFPDVAEGDVVGARICNGKCEFLHQGSVIHRVGVQGHFRFVACLGSTGQRVCIQGTSAEWKESKTNYAKLVPHVEVGKGTQELSFDTSKPLGEGGFGIVYRGKLWGDDVVVKKMRESTMTPELEQNFEQEVQALASLHHRNLIIFLAMNASEHLIVTEFCEGGDLKSYLKGDGLTASAEMRRRLMLDVCKGMACITARGMVHRDLKPDNIFVAMPGPIAKVGDFGLVKTLAKCQSEGSIAGTIMYMAPEVFAGDVSEKSDVYAFSLVLGFAFGMPEFGVESLTGVTQALFIAQLLQEPAAVQHVIIQSIRNGKRPAIPDTVPTEIQALVKEGWDENPSRRPTFASLCESLTQPLADCRCDSRSVARMRKSLSQVG